MPNRSEEVQDIIDRMPTRWCAWVAFIVFILMGTLFLVSFLIRYPDTVDGEISVTGASAPIRLVVNAHGCLHLLKKANQDVLQNVAIAYIENGADYDDVQTLKTSLECSDKILPSNLKLGELGSSYNAYLIAIEHWERLKHSNKHTIMRKSLGAQIASNEKVANQLSTILELKKRIRENLQREVERDSILAQRMIVSESELKKTQNLYLAQMETEASLRNSQLTNQSEINTFHIEIARSYIEEEERLEEAYVDMMTKRNLLQTELCLWEEKYVIKVA